MTLTEYRNQYMCTNFLHSCSKQVVLIDGLCSSQFSKVPTLDVLNIYPDEYQLQKIQLSLSFQVIAICTY